MTSAAVLPALSDEVAWVFVCPLSLQESTRSGSCLSLFQFQLSIHHRSGTLKLGTEFELNTVALASLGLGGCKSGSFEYSTTVI